MGPLTAEVGSILGSNEEGVQKARRLYAAYGRRGLHALLIPRDKGGRGLDHLSAGMVYEALSYELPGTLHGTITTAHCAAMIMSGMNNAFHGQRLRAIAGPDHPAAFCLTEKDAGSDMGAIRTRAEKASGCYVLTGEKAVAINHAVAGTLLAIAVVPPASGRAALNAFAVDASSGGIDIGPAWDAPGLAGGVLGPVAFNGVRIPEECLLGEMGSGYLLFMETLDKGRPLVAACCTGEAERALDLALDYARGRSQFGKVLYSFQDVSFAMAEAATRIKAARLLWKDALQRIDRGRPFTMESSMAKLFAAQTLMDTASLALDLMGYRAIGERTLIERIHMGARLMKSIDGTPAVQKMVIASQL
jgi:alkylation response protein AidB-like acyl-CoA dehydrogenase